MFNIANKGYILLQENHASEYYYCIAYKKSVASLKPHFYRLL